MHGNMRKKSIFKKVSFLLIPSKMIKEAVYSTKKRAVKLVEAKGEAFEGISIRAGIRI